MIRQARQPQSKSYPNSEPNVDPVQLVEDNVTEDTFQRIHIPCNTQKVLHGCNSFFPLTFSKKFHFLLFEFFNNFLLSGWD